jgi:hypothetical protein
MIYDDLVRTLGVDPSIPFIEPTTPAFSVFGYKMRKRLAGDVNRVLREAGFAPKRIEIEMRKDG